MLLQKKYENFNPSLVGQYSELTFEKNNFDENVVHLETTVKNAVLFTPFYGVQYNFSKRFFFSMQIHLQFQYNVVFKIIGLLEPCSPLNIFSSASRF